MRLLKVLAIILTAMVTQSCKITMPSLVKLISSYDARVVEPRENPYRFNESEAIKMQTGFKDTLVIGDDLETFHGVDMRNIMTIAGIPEKNIVFFEMFAGFRLGHNTGLNMFVSDEWTWLREAARVAHLPLLGPFTGHESHSLVAGITNVLFVTAAGNMRTYWHGDRDLYNSNHVGWSSSDPEMRQVRKEAYQGLLDVHRTDRVIAATSARITDSGDVHPNEGVVKCGDIKESCYTMTPHSNTSSASARLSAIAFYLSQFWETPEEVVDVLNECVIDVGEPGVDREYGRGVVNLLCPRVLKKEIEVVAEHLKETEGRILTQGENSTGTWIAEKTALQVRLPKALQRTLQAQYTGEVTGTVEFKENTVTTDFTAKADVNVTFLLPIEVKAEDSVQIEGEYTAETNRLNIRKNNTVVAEYTYTATEDSLHIVKSLSLNDVLRLLPGVVGDLAKKDTRQILENDPIQIRMSFAKVTVSSIPENLRETDVTDNTITLQWDEPEEIGSSPISAYRITRYTDASCTDISEVKETAEQKIQFTDLRANTEYYFSAEAKNNVGWSKKSDCLKVKTDPIPGDFDGNNIVDLADFLLFATVFGTTETDAAFNEQMDLVPDGMINIADFLVFAENFGKTRDS